MFKLLVAPIDALCYPAYLMPKHLDFPTVSYENNAVCTECKSLSLLNRAHMVTLSRPSLIFFLELVALLL